ncbi:Signal transduction histidine kinase [Anaerocolumna jejuensis DSM 15929]|uniref:histidine kinase n=1 Tax=Anaerocolumna jejuensis DSM 15929 TaxID=1121322 RepID=A0A1M7CSW2_9FIRM|nr:HAMP domain-containing sensor histidine kinase [Anaerocolumna jejuensis]SHL70408.1 Signal transduction histidine kinase [Anaerocolumna jejuensis DSM 15929]
MKYSLKQKLTFSYVIIVVASIGFAILFANVGIRNQFKHYAIQKQGKETEEIISLIRMKYEEEGGWSSKYLDLIGMNALQNGMTLVIKDTGGKVIWSAYEHNNGLCQIMIKNMALNMSSYSNKWDGRYEEKSYPIKEKNSVIAELTTGFMGPYYFNDEELLFIKALNSILVFAGVTSVLLAVFLGIFMSVRLSNPLKKISDKALFLAKGEYKERITEDLNTREIKILADTINQLSDALMEKDRLRGQLTQDVAHELRTPLTSVQGHMEAMLDGVWELSNERLLSCYEEIMRLKSLIGSIEDLSASEDKNILLHKEEFEFSSLVERLLHNYEKELSDKKMQVKLRGRLEEKNAGNLNYGDIIYGDVNYGDVIYADVIYADKDKMCQVLNNLLSNAVKYCDRGAEVIITLEQEAGQAVIKVSDNGNGISQEDLPHIFERFYRADKSRNSNTGGAGIGLSITKSIVEAHGGSITASSEYGKGTEFTILLPGR